MPSLLRLSTRWGLGYRRGKSDTPLDLTRAVCSAVETKVCVVCTARMKIHTGIGLKRTRLAMSLDFTAEITEITPVTNVVWMCHKLTSEKMKSNVNDLA